MGANEIVILGAREHNLKDISLTLPRDRLIVITGLSGSGKSSLAFDTIYAEGQRRYVESLSSYARQFLGQMSKPDVDSIEGLSPAISIDQKTTSRNPRSTVGTVTEIYDYLRLLYARIGLPHCWICGRLIEGQSKEQIVDQILGLEPGTRFVVKAPVVRSQKGWHKDVLDHIRQEGFTRVEIDGVQYSLDEALPDLDKNVRHDVSIIVDRLVMKEGVRRRLSDSVETALSEAHGLLVVDVYGEGGGAGGGGEVDVGRSEEVAGVSTGRTAPTTLLFSENLACPEHGVSLPEMAPRIFSFNSPHGACETCSGLGAHREIDPALLVGDPSLSVAEGVLLPWSNSGSNYYEQVIKAIGERYEIDMSTPWRDLPPHVQDIFLYGTKGDRLHITWEARGGFKRSYMTDFEGIVRNLERRYRETDSEYIRERIDQYMSDRPCPSCGGARLKPSSLAVTVGGLNITQLSMLSVTGAIRFLDELQLTEREQLIGARVLKEIRERLLFLDAVGVGYLSLHRAAGTLSGGEAQRIRLATQIGSSLVGVLYILDEPSIGLHQRDNRKLIDTLIRLRDLGNTVIVVEHDEETMRSADHIVDMGPGAGEHGGRVVAEGPPAAMAESWANSSGLSEAPPTRPPSTSGCSSSSPIPRTGSCPTRRSSARCRRPNRTGNGWPSGTVSPAKPGNWIASSPGSGAPSCRSGGRISIPGSDPSSRSRPKSPPCGGRSTLWTPGRASRWKAWRRSIGLPEPVTALQSVCGRSVPRRKGLWAPAAGPRRSGANWRPTPPWPQAMSPRRSPGGLCSISGCRSRRRA